MKKELQSTYFCTRLYLMVMTMIGIHLVSAQPTALITSMNGNLNCVNLSDKGTTLQSRLLATTSSTFTSWEFASSCSNAQHVWRPSAFSPIGFNNVIIPNATANTGALYNGTMTGTTFSTTTGRYYTFNVEKKAAPNHLKMAILETAFLPATFQSLLHFPSSPQNNTPIQVSVVMHQLPSSNEQVFVRFADNPAFSNSSVISMTMTGKKGRATIPAQSTTQLYYYAFTSPLVTLSNPEEADLLALEKTQIVNVSFSASFVTYEMSVSKKVYTPIVAGQTTGVAAADEAISPNVALPFNFTLGNSTYSHFQVSTNGWIALNNATPLTTPVPNNGALYSATMNPNTVLAPWWDDMVLDGSSAITYEVSGAAPHRTLTIQYENYLAFKMNAAAARLNFQVKLYELDNAIEFIYGTKTSGVKSMGESASMGIEWGAGGPLNFMDAAMGSNTMSNAALNSDQFPTGTMYRFVPGGQPSALEGGIYNAGESGIFESLHAAFACLNQRGIAGPVEVKLTDNLYTNAQSNVFPLVLGAINGTSAQNTITVEGNQATLQATTGITNGNVTYYGTTNTVIAGATHEPVLMLAGSDYVKVQNLTIVGALGNNGTDRGIKVTNVLPTDGANYNTLQNITIALDRTNANTIAIEQIALANVSSMSGVNTYNKYFNLTITQTNAGILLSGNATFPDVNCTVGTVGCGQWNQIGGTTAGDIGGGASAVYGIQAMNQKGVSIYNNIVKNLTSNGAFNVDGIWINNGYMTGAISGDSVKVFNNIIHTLSNSNANAGRVSGMRISINAHPDSKSFVFNNNVSNLQSASLVTSSRRIVGIMLQDAAGGVGAEHNIDNNSVSIHPMNVSCTNTCFEVGTYTGPIYKIRNNIFANFTGAQTGNAKHYCWSTIVNQIGPLGSVSDNNDLYIANAANGCVGLGAFDMPSLATWRAYMNVDNASIATDPGFMSMTDLHVSSLALNGAANMANSGWVVKDLDCNVRSFPHDIGSDDFSPVTLDVGAFSLNNPVMSGCYFTPQAVAVSIKNYAIIPHNFATNPVKVQVQITRPDGSVVTVLDSITSGTLASQSVQSLTLLTGFVMNMGGAYAFAVSTQLIGDENNANNAIPAVAINVTAPSSLPVASLQFNGFTGTNLTSIHPLWKEASGNALPSGTTSLWAQAVLTPGNTTARINLSTNIRREWLVGPKCVPTASTRLRFKAAITAAGTSAFFPTGMIGTDDKVFVMVSTDCGLSFFPIYTFDANHYPSNQLTEYTINLMPYVGQEVIVAFYATDGISDDVQNYDFHVDDIEIKAVPAVDAAVTQIVPPLCFNANALATVKVKNNGSAPLNFAQNAGVVYMNYSINGVAQPALTATLNTGSLLEGEVRDVVVAVDMTTAGNYSLSGGINLTGDGDATNNNAFNATKYVPQVAISMASAVVCANEIKMMEAVADNHFKSIGNGLNTNTAMTYPSIYGGLYENARHQILFLASELSALGMTNGSKIKEIAFPIIALNGVGTLNHLQIKYKFTTEIEATTDFDNTGLTSAYTLNTPYQPVLGLNSHTLTSPIVWNGVDNLLLDISFENDVNSMGNFYSYNAAMPFTQTAFSSVTYHMEDNANIENTLTGVTSAARPNILLGLEATPAWFPSQGLFTDAAATQPYIEGMKAQKVYVKNASVGQYTATFIYENCFRSASIALTTIPNLMTTDATSCNGFATNLATLVSDASNATGTLSYYATYADALNQTQPLSNATVSPAQTKAYFVRKDVNATGTCFDLASVNVNVNGFLTQIPATDGTVKNADYEVVDGVWTHYYDDAGTPTVICDDYLLLSLKKNGNAIGTVGDGTFSLEIAGAPGVTNVTKTTAPYVQNRDWYVMNRFWNVHPTAQPTSDIQVRFYYTDDDFDSLTNISEISLQDHSELHFFKINGGIYDPDPSLGHVGVPYATSYNLPGYWQYEHGAAPSHTEWAYAAVGNGHSAEWVISSFSGGGGGAGNNGGALPMVLLQFTGYNSGEVNVLKWETAMEEGLDYFEVQASPDGENFVNIATLQSKGGAHQGAKYTYGDERPFEGQNYYRLRLVDTQGDYSFSEIKKLTVAGSMSVEVFPNPASDIGNMVITGADGTVRFILYDDLGRVVKSEKWNVDGYLKTQVNVENLPTGVYKYQVRNDDISINGNLMIQQ